MISCILQKQYNTTCVKKKHKDIWIEVEVQVPKPPSWTLENVIEDIDAVEQATNVDWASDGGLMLKLRVMKRLGLVLQRLLKLGLVSEDASDVVETRRCTVKVDIETEYESDDESDYQSDKSVDYLSPGEDELIELRNRMKANRKAKAKAKDKPD
ncbi:hypothetical protein Tco_1160129 [Tanacetum coccineum]